jgi:tetratricopeptide (TPR) repeat protein
VDEEDLQAFARMWEQAPDGWSGRRYAEALLAAGRLDDAAGICRAMWDLGYPAGLTDLAHLERDRGHHDLAIALLVEALPDLDDEDRPRTEGTLGHWLWSLKDDPGAEPHLRAGQDVHPTARADLAHLLLVTGRSAEARSVLRAGVEAGETESMLPLANLLDRDGDPDGAERLYRWSYELGDAYSAWNLFLLLVVQGRAEEAEQWRWRAAQGGDEFAIRYYSDDPYEEPPT